jgi:hypothetical protein
MSNPQKYFLMIKEIHKCPLDSHITNCHHNGGPNGGTEFPEPLKKSIIRIFPIYKAA